MPWHSGLRLAILLYTIRIALVAGLVVRALSLDCSVVGFNPIQGSLIFFFEKRAVLGLIDLVMSLSADWNEKH